MSVPRQGTPEWYEWRKGGIGASELPAILGVDPFTTEFAVAAEKRGMTEREPENDAQAWGKRIQRAALEVAADMMDWRVRESHTTVVSKRYPHVYASLDGRIVGRREGVEVKLTKDRWEDEPPKRVVIQTLGQMGVHELDRVHVVKVGMYYSPPLIFTVERDDKVIDDLLPMGEEWYLRYCTGDELPPLDGSAAASRYLNGIHGVPEQQASLDQAALASRLRNVRARLKALEAEDSDLVVKLKASMQGAYRLTGDDFAVSWKPSKPSERTDWKSVAAAYRGLLEGPVGNIGIGAAMNAVFEGREPPDLDAIESLHTVTTEGARPFRVTFEEPDL